MATCALFGSVVAFGMVASVYVRTLRLAAEILGGQAELQRFLAVPGEVLVRWLRGDELPPTHAFLRSVDILAAARDRKSL